MVAAAVATTQISSSHASPPPPVTLNSHLPLRSAQQLQAAINASISAGNATCVFMQPLPFPFLVQLEDTAGISISLVSTLMNPMHLISFPSWPVHPMLMTSSRYTIPTGAYNFDDGSPLLLYRATDFILEAHAAVELWFKVTSTWRTGGVLLLECSNVVVQGQLTVDYDPPAYYQGINITQ